MYSMDCVGVDYFNREIIRCTLHFLLFKEKDTMVILFIFQILWRYVRTL